MDMEDKESTYSGSFGGNSESESPPVSSAAVVGGANGGHGGFIVPRELNMRVGMNMDSSLREAVVQPPLPPVTSGGGMGVSGGGSLGMGVSGDLKVKKKRGRPTKYDADGNLRVQYMASPPGSGGATPPGFSLTSPSREFSLTKRGRGRPHGSGNWQSFASMGEAFANTAGADFIPHVVTVQTGEDVAGKLLSIAQTGPRGICILSANGTISNVTIRQPGFSGGLLTYEGRFEILTLTGSFTPSENNGMKSRTGGLSISLAGPDGRVVGGGVAGGLLAASPIQVVFGSFMPNSNKVHKKQYIGAPIVNNAPDIVTEAMPISQATLANNITPLPTVPFSIQSRGEVNNSIINHRENPNSTLTGSADYNNSGPPLDARHYPDINVSISFD